MTPEQETATDLALRHEAWWRGELRWKMHLDQRRVHDAIEARNASREVLEIARKWGKTYYLVLRSFIKCLREPRIRIVYGAPTYKHLTEFVLPVIDEICQDAPAGMRPKYREATGHLEFHNGSWIHFFGADDKQAADRGRGPKAIEAIFDEAGFCPVLSYVLRAVFRPSLLLSGNGKTVLASSPAEEPDHDFTRMAERAEVNGTYARRTIHDNPLLTPEQIAKFIADDAKDEGMLVGEYIRSPTFRREYMAERVSETSLMVMGDDWTKTEASVVREVERPKFFDAYTMFDLGGVDPHAFLFGYFHFGLAALVFEDELLFREGQNTAILAEALRTTEQRLWGASKFDGTLRGLDEVEKERLPLWLKKEMALNAPPQPFLRVCDSATQIVIDMHALHGIAMLPAQKDDKVLAVNAFRVAVRSGHIIVHPRCRNLIRHLRQTLWQNPQMRTYRRNAAGEHGDLLDCAIYGNRTVIRARNPTPINFGMDTANMWAPPAKQPGSELGGLFSRRRM